MRKFKGYFLISVYWIIAAPLLVIAFPIAVLKECSGIILALLEKCVPLKLRDKGKDMLYDEEE